MKIRPTQDYVLLQPQRADEVTKGGIIIPDNARERTQRGEVLAVGPGRTLDDGRRVAVDVAPGDVVLYAMHTDQKTSNAVDAAEDGPVLVRESDIMGVLS